MQGVDIIVVPAREEGFKEVFLGENEWRLVWIHGGMICRSRYVAAYQVDPISATTHISPVKEIAPPDTEVPEIPAPIL